MASSALLSLGTRAMSAAYAQLQTTSHNISNANTPGYSRQEVVLATAGGQFTGAGFFGKGVDVETVQRSHNELLSREAAITGSQAARDSARLTQLNQLESIFPTGQAGIGYAAGQLLNAFVDVGNSPADSSARQVVLTRAAELAARFVDAGKQLDSLQSGVSTDLKNSIANVNTLADGLAKLNRQITAVRGLGQAPNDLLDQRDELVAKISEYVQVTTVPADDGSLSVFVGSGQALVVAGTSTKLGVSQDAYDPAQFHLGVPNGATTRLIADDSLAGGSIAGLLQFQREDLVDARNLLGQLATAISGAMNEQQALGLDLSGSAGAAFFSVGNGRVLPAASNGGTATIGVTVADASAVKASDYELRFDGTSYTLTRLSDNSAAAGNPYTAAQLSAGITVDGLTIQRTAGTTAAGDRFLLQPMATAAKSMSLALSDPNRIAAAGAPMTATVGTGNSGTATIASLTTGASTDATLRADITFTSATAYSWSLSDGSTGTGTWTSGSPLTLNGWQLSLDGAPATGDTISVGASDNGNALAFAALGDAKLVDGSTVTDGYSAAMTDIAVRVQTAQTSSNISTSAAAAAEEARSNDSGVNLDEEAARLIQYQQSYQAAAKVLQVAQTIFDTLLQAAGN